MREDEIGSSVTETLAEQQKLYRNDIDAAILRTIATILTSFGIEEEDRRELRADFERSWAAFSKCGRMRWCSFGRKI
jgi:hypothetical protein